MQNGASGRPVSGGQGEQHGSMAAPTDPERQAHWSLMRRGLAVSMCVSTVLRACKKRRAWRCSLHCAERDGCVLLMRVWDGVFHDYFERMLHWAVGEQRLSGEKVTSEKG